MNIVRVVGARTWAAPTGVYLLKSVARQCPGNIRRALIERRAAAAFGEGHVGDVGPLREGVLDERRGDRGARPGSADRRVVQAERIGQGVRIAAEYPRAALQQSVLKGIAGKGDAVIGWRGH